MASELARAHEECAHEDQSFIEQLRQMCRSRSDFLLAIWRGNPRDAYERAWSVLVWRNGAFVSIEEIYSSCESRTSRQIYEAWAYETGQRLRAEMRTLDDLAARALRCIAGDVLKTTGDEAYESVQEACEALYGAAAP